MRNTNSINAMYVVLVSLLSEYFLGRIKEGATDAVGLDEVLCTIAEVMSYFIAVVVSTLPEDKKESYIDLQLECLCKALRLLVNEQQKEFGSSAGNADTLSIDKGMLKNMKINGKIN